MKNIIKIGLITMGLLVMLFLAGCDDNQQYRFFNNGQEVVCNYGEFNSDCGYSLSHCNDNQQYNCVTNIRVVRIT